MIQSLEDQKDQIKTLRENEKEETIEPIRFIIKEYIIELEKIKSEISPGNYSELMETIGELLVHLADCYDHTRATLKILEPDFFDVESLLGQQLSYVIEKYRNLLKYISKSRIQHLTFSSHIPNSFGFIDYILNNSALQTLTIDAEYFESALIESPFFYDAVNSAPQLFLIRVGVGECQEDDDIRDSYKEIKKEFLNKFDP
ncbi:MAG: hypothetical protein K2Q14_00855, partial [Gammaproteobacteria bacterium]|nr:hypothetical protein [Gammaproteobacteria bacterium]